MLQETLHTPRSSKFSIGPIEQFATIKTFFHSDTLYITNYPRDLGPLACFLAIHFAHKGNFSSTKTC